jgi:pyruvate-formate lyase-activating enzyme
MHLLELLRWRVVPAAGVSIGLTRRCPLQCAHCSTNSTMRSEEHSATIFERFVDSFSSENRPEILSMSGGEAMLRPTLVRSLAERARRVGTRSSVLSGLFFARHRRIPPAIEAAIDAVDHFSVSLDTYHEQEVPRDSVFRLLDAVLIRGTDVSLHLVGAGEDDPYLEALITEVRRRFDSRVPMLVNVVSHFGRARAWLPLTQHVYPGQVGANPCSMAAWPVVGFDGRIAACGNDDALDNLPAHLDLGHAARDDWATVRARTLESTMLRAIRLFGPEYIAESYRDGGLNCDGYCQTCMALPQDAGLEQRMDALMARPSTSLIEAQVSAWQQSAGAVSFLRRHGMPRYANLVTLGAPI